MAKKQTYDEKSIAILEGLEAVRKRPGMYIGSVTTKGLNHLIYEIVDNSVDEHLAGACDTIRVTLEKNGSCTVEDNGRGIPVGMHAKGVSAARVVFSTLHAGGKFDNSVYKTSGGLHGVGSSVVNALSTYMDVEISRDGYIHHDRYEKGVAIFGETCTHYLTITTDALEKPGFEGAKAVCSPALRSQDHLDAMWEAVKKGWLNAISSDHCGFNYETHKHAGYGEGKTFADIPNGAPGLENRIPVVWTEGVEKGKISRKKFVELIATNPAKINGLFPQKGTLAVGSDADVVIWDPTYKGTISIENSLQGCDYCAFEGFDQIGRADKVFLRGELVADAGKYVGEKGSGKFVPGKPYGLCYELA